MTHPKTQMVGTLTVSSVEYSLVTTVDDEVVYRHMSQDSVGIIEDIYKAELAVEKKMTQKDMDDA